VVSSGAVCLAVVTRDVLDVSCVVCGGSVGLVQTPHVFRQFFFTNLYLQLTFFTDLQEYKSSTHGVVEAPVSVVIVSVVEYSTVALSLVVSDGVDAILDAAVVEITLSEDVEDIGVVDDIRVVTDRSMHSPHVRRQFSYTDLNRQYVL